MEVNARVEPQNTTVDNRFQVMAVVDRPNLRREKGKRYLAIHP